MNHQLGTRVVRRLTPHHTRGHRVLLAVVALALVGLAGTGLMFWLQGYRVYVLYTGSMSPTLRPGDLLVDRPANNGYRVGDIITFRKSASNSEVVTHRVAAIAPQSITTKGDANRTTDASAIPPDQVKGSLAYDLRGFGYLVVYFREPAGIASLVTTSLAIIFLWGLFFPPPAAASAGEKREPDLTRTTAL